MGLSKGAISERKERIISGFGGQNIFSLEDKKVKGSCHADRLFFLWDMERACVTGYLTGVPPEDS